MFQRIKDAWNKRKAEKNLSKGTNSILGDDPVHYDKLPEDFSPKLDGAKLDINSEYKEVIPPYYEYDENGEFVR